MWFSEVRNQFGDEKAFEIFQKVLETGYDIHLKRLSKIMGFELTTGLPEPLLKKSVSELEAIKENLAIGWLANDGIWFQAVENSYGMTDAKKCNDSCWAQFSPFEAWSVKKLLDLPDASGLEGLKKALGFRLYASINKQEITDETPESFVFRMVDCRVQSARKRKGLEDYPCKSAGIIEYSSFAQSIDNTIKTKCIACPPDEHPENWFCAWMFYV